MLAEPLMWVKKPMDCFDVHRFEYVENKIWYENTTQQFTIYHTEISRNGSGLDLVVVLRRNRDGMYFRLAEGEVRSSKRLDMIEQAKVLYEGEWKKAKQSSAKDSMEGKIKNRNYNNKIKNKTKLRN